MWRKLDDQLQRMEEAAASIQSGLGGSAQLLGLVEAEAETAARRQRDVARNTGVCSTGFSVCMRRAEVLAAEGLDLEREVTQLVLELDEEDRVILGDMIGEGEADDDVADAMRLAESELVTQKFGAQKIAALGGKARRAQSPTTTRAQPDRARPWRGGVEELGERLGEALQVVGTMLDEA